MIYKIISTPPKEDPSRIIDDNSREKFIRGLWIIFKKESGWKLKRDTICDLFFQASSCGTLKNTYQWAMYQILKNPEAITIPLAELMKLVGMHAAHTIISIVKPLKEPRTNVPIILRSYYSPTPTKVKRVEEKDASMEGRRKTNGVKTKQSKSPQEKVQQSQLPGSKRPTKFKMSPSSTGRSQSSLGTRRAHYLTGNKKTIKSVPKATPQSGQNYIRPQTSLGVGRRRNSGSKNALFSGRKISSPSVRISQRGRINGSGPKVQGLR